MKPKKQIEVKPEIMDELLSQPEVAQHVKNMTAAEFDFYKRLLVSQGIYARYVKELKKKETGKEVKKNGNGI